MFQSFVVNMRWREPSSLDFEDCDEPRLVEIGEDCDETSLVETDEENSDVDAECWYYSGLYRLLETDTAKSGSNAQNATSGAMKSVRV